MRPPVLPAGAAGAAGSDESETSAGFTSDGGPARPLGVPRPLPRARPVTSATASTPKAPALGWEVLDERERRRRLDAMDPDALRALAASMPVIEQAKGVLMGCFGVDAEAAFAILRRVSSTRNLKLRLLAAVVVDAASGRPGVGQAAGMSPGDQVRQALQQVQVLAGDEQDDGQGDGRAARGDDEEGWS